MAYQHGPRHQKQSQFVSGVFWDTSKSIPEDVFFFNLKLSEPCKKLSRGMLALSEEHQMLLNFAGTTEKICWVRLSIRSVYRCRLVTSVPAWLKAACRLTSTPVPCPARGLPAPASTLCGKRLGAWCSDLLSILEGCKLVRTPSGSHAWAPGGPVPCPQMPGHVDLRVNTPLCRYDPGMEMLFSACRR